MLIRFIIGRTDPDSGRRQGLFQALGELRDSGRMLAHDHARLWSITDWFGENLRVPPRFSLSSAPHRKAQAICWFRDSARRHIARMWEVETILSDYGVDVLVIRTRKPGYVVYQDEHQVTAYPFADTQA
jgi:hypothetical protein